MKSKALVFKARTNSSRPADMELPYSPACVITHTFLLNTGAHLIWDQEKQL